MSQFVHMYTVYHTRDNDLHERINCTTEEIAAMEDPKNSGNRAHTLINDTVICFSLLYTLQLKD